MSRRLAGLDRVVVAVVGLVLVAVGVLAVLWQRDLVSWLQPRITTRPLGDATTTAWWAWAVGAVGAVLMVVALRWLFAHLFRARVGSAILAGSDRTGRLSVELGAVAAAAAKQLDAEPGVSGTKSAVRSERGCRTIVLTVTAESDADVPHVISAVERVHDELATALPDPSIAVRVQLHINTPGAAPARTVH
ncbi:MAG: alkaline shock response membrane anchor protein AmaP [Mycobacteriaceae bacterium]